MKRLCAGILVSLVSCQAADIPSFHDPFGDKENISRRITINLPEGRHAQALLHVYEKKPIEPGNWIEMETFHDHTAEQTLAAHKNEPLSIAVSTEQQVRVKVNVNGKDYWTILKKGAGKHEFAVYNHTVVCYTYHDQNSGPQMALLWPYMKREDRYHARITLLKAHALQELLRKFKQNTH